MGRVVSAFLVALLLCTGPTEARYVVIDTLSAALAEAYAVNPLHSRKRD
jgi:hypothetical protein